MVMSAKTNFWIAVIGLSGRENGDSFKGPGKSSLCDRFISPEKQPTKGHTSIISQQDFHGPIVNTDHFLYWGRTKRTVDGKVVEFNVIEQTEFLDDVSFSSFNARDPYFKRSTTTTINSSRKIQYISPEQLQDPQSCKAQKFSARKIHIDGFLCVYDVSKVSDRTAGTQYRFIFELLDLIDVPVVLVATKCDKGRSRHFEEMMYLAKVQKVPIVETSAIENVNVSQAFFSLVRIFNRQIIVSKKHIQYFSPKSSERSNKIKKKKKVKENEEEKSVLSKSSKTSGTLKSTRHKVASPTSLMSHNGSIPSHNGSATSQEWRHSPLLSSIHTNDPLPTSLSTELLLSSHSSPNPESLNSIDTGPEYEHINGENDHYENHMISETVNEPVVGETDSQNSQSKTSSGDEYIPVPRCAYDPADNYENVRYHQKPGSDCSSGTGNIVLQPPSPQSQSSDSDRGFLVNVPEHMKTMASHRPWESQWSNEDIPPPIIPRSRQISDQTSGTRSSSSIDTDMQANIRLGQQLVCRSNLSSAHSSASSGSISVERDSSSSCHSAKSESRASSAERMNGRTPNSGDWDKIHLQLMRANDRSSPLPECDELPPFPIEEDIPPHFDYSVELRRDLDEMNDLVGEISHLVWQNEPLPPPPDLNEDLLTPHPQSRESIPDFEKTPTNELASPHNYDNVECSEASVDGDVMKYDSDLCYENVTQPEVPPRQPTVPPRPGPNIPSRISRSDAEKWNLTPTVPTRDLSPGPREIVPPRIVKGHQGNSLKPNNMINIPHRVPAPPSRTNFPPHIPARQDHHINDTTPQIIIPPRISVPPRVPLPPRPSPKTLPPRNHQQKHLGPVYTAVECKTPHNGNWGNTKKYNNSLPHDWSPYVMPIPASEIWNENDENIEQKMTKTFKKKVKMKNAGKPQR